MGFIISVKLHTLYDQFSFLISGKKKRYEYVKDHSEYNFHTCINFGKDYLGAKFLYTEPISLNKAHLTK